MRYSSYERTTRRLADPLPKGSILDGKFMIVRLLARTKFSTVYEGRDLRNNKRVIIKRLACVPHPGGLARSEAVLLFKREARMLARLRHPQVPRLHAASISMTDAYIVMDYIEGMTLERFLKRITLPLPMALDLCDRLCALVAELHTQPPHVLHNDLKPRNIMLTPDGRIILIDFGLACFRGERWPLSVSLGTPDYIAPEAARGMPLDERSDMYALGQVLLDILEPTATPALLGVFERATATEPVARYATVAQLRQALQTAATMQCKPASQPDDEWNRWLAAIIVALALGLLGVVYELRTQGGLQQNMPPLAPIITPMRLPGS